MHKILIYPDNCNIMNVPLGIGDTYSKSLDYELLEKREGEFTLWFDNSVGAFLGVILQFLKKMILTTRICLAGEQTTKKDIID